MKKLLAISIALWANISFAHFYGVSGIEVRVHASNAVDGKEKAQSESIKLAFAQLISDHYNDFGVDVSQVLERDIWECVYDFSIEKEKYSSAIYIGRFVYRFDDNKVKNLIGKVIGKQLDTKNSNLVCFVADLSDFVNYLSRLKEIKIDKFQHDRVMFYISADKVEKLKSLNIKCTKL